MDELTVLTLVKARLGVLSDIIDDYLIAIIGGVLDEMDTQYDIMIEADNKSHLMFIVDFSVYRYQMRDSDKGMPMHLISRLRNLYIAGRG